MRPHTILLAFLAAAPLTACADLAETSRSAPFATASVPVTLAVEVAPDEALARLPAAAGAVVSVTERREGGRLTQEVALAGDATARGANRIRVVASDHDGAARKRMTEERLEAELAAELPGVDMRVVPRVASAGGVALGLASGRSPAGGACVYAWQETVATPRGGRSGGLFARDDVDLSVRVRLCRQTMSEETLVALVEGLTLRGDVAPKGGRMASGATGVDALASAGYARPSPRAVEPVRIAQPMAEARPAKAVEPRPTTPAVEVPKPREASPRAANLPAPRIAADPIPLPSGG